MAIRRDLLKWQLNGYDSNHENKVNRVIHVLTVPLFWCAWILIGRGLYAGSLNLIGLGSILLLTPLIAQGVGHKLEAKKPEPFLGPLDFVSRFFAEQLITYPRGLLTKLSSRH